MWGPSNLLGLKQQHGEESFFPASKRCKKKVDLAVLSHCKRLPKGKKEDYDASVQACKRARALCVCVLNQSATVSGTNTDLVKTCGPHGGQLLLLMKVNAPSPSNLRVCVHTRDGVCVDSSKPSAELKDRCRYRSPSWFMISCPVVTRKRPHQCRDVEKQTHNKTSEAHARWSIYL